MVKNAIEKIKQGEVIEMLWGRGDVDQGKFGEGGGGIQAEMLMDGMTFMAVPQPTWFPAVLRGCF